IGLVLGMTGAGGSVVAVPLLMAGLGYAFPAAAGVSLGAVALGALTGVLLRLRAGGILWGLAAVLAVSGVLLAPLGQWVGRHVAAPLLLSSFVVLMLFMAWRLWRQAVDEPALTLAVRADAGPEEEDSGPACPLSSSGRFEWRWPCLRRLLMVGALTGFLSGLYGVGGGFVIVPMLVLLTGLPMRQAVATSLLVISVVAGSAFALFLVEAPLPAGFWGVAAGAVAGMLVGSLLARRVAGPRLQQGFALLMVALAADMALTFFR
ncbi:MAG: sulfite exporter TauE/SafE family protein, partial [Moraxellaceae bacterium]|nr:sulfite exporter TauE/SafE family protein [Moraxellaceae bacterium]